MVWFVAYTNGDEVWLDYGFNEFKDLNESGADEVLFDCGFNEFNGADEVLVACGFKEFNNFNESSVSAILTLDLIDVKYNRIYSCSNQAYCSRADDAFCQHTKSK